MEAGDILFFEDSGTSGCTSGADAWCTRRSPGGTSKSSACDDELWPAPHRSAPRRELRPGRRAGPSRVPASYRASETSEGCAGSYVGR